ARTGAYKTLVEKGHDLHELHALMAPRPFFVGGGREDKPHRWKVLNQAIRLNEFLGWRDRVGMHSRPEHRPSPEAATTECDFLEYMLLHGGIERQTASVDAPGDAGSAVPNDDLTEPLPQAWDYADAMRTVAARFRGTQGKVIHIGCSDTIANPYTTWARQGKGKTDEDRAVLAWMHTEKRNEN